ncbi:cleavage and polyadenylation specificity factor subunit 2 [Geosmithia morbida]|uniref:Cleavage and polyadenylation specificity factor subunit 2 n=1 Tax=Geosmithia morbida TaxID=1094350 RepID=A0A9P5D708_9HYPO|nr:cleavage and polyadenylation specificity factor subunit 2 [Geosmithia morbida]KAF4126121.1 cleavage and polyadenylation specificity factor subunit 2 [Geosmithia morbida]
MFTFCSLQGALTESPASQSLLELDGGVKVLVDVGWDESFDVNKLRELEKQIPTLSLILLTHAKASHLAAYAHCCKNFPLFTRVPVYATRPIIDLGRTLLQDLYSSAPAAATTIPRESLTDTMAYGFLNTQTTSRSATDDKQQQQQQQGQGQILLEAPTADEIARYFSLIQPLKYSQPHQPLPSPFSPPLNGLTITAYNSGHTLGGTIWHLQHGLESIVYAVDWNQARENVFAGAAWLGGAGGGGADVIEALRKPTALICSSRGGDRNAPAGGRAKRDEHLLDLIRPCVARGGTVLIPVDSSARVLEMAYLLEHAWRSDDGGSDGSGVSLKSARLYLAGRNMSSTMRYGRSMLEWMDDSIVQEFEAFAEGQRKVNGAAGEAKAGGGGPFDFKYLRLVERRAQIAKLLGQDAVEGAGRVILASDASMDWGFSRDLFRGLAHDPRNLVILTDRPGVARCAGSPPSVARTLWQWWSESKQEQDAQQVGGDGRVIELHEAKRQALEGDELAVYEQWLTTQRHLQSTQQTGGAAGLEASGDVVDDASSESESESEDEDGEKQGKALNVSAALGQAGRKKVVLRDEDLGINVLIKKKDVYDFEVRGKKGRERSFPLAVRRKRTDDYGELIRPEDFLRAEEKEDDTAGGVPSGVSPAGTADDDDKLGKKRKWGDVAKATATSAWQQQAGEGGTSSSQQQQQQQQQQHGEDGGEGVVPDELDTAVDNEVPEVSAQQPSKLVYTPESIAVNLRIAFADFSGLHDKRSLNMLIPLIQPRKLILVGGNREETTALAADCRVALGGGGGGAESGSAVEILVPEMGVSVDASVDTNSWVVRLADGLVKELRWQNVKGLGIVTISGQLLTQARAAATASQSSTTTTTMTTTTTVGSVDDDEQSTPSKRRKTEGTAAREAADETANVAGAMPMLDVISTNNLVTAAAARSAASRPLHVGDLRLADLRRAMQSARHTAEFRGEGTLVVDGTVAVKKTAEGRIEVESVGLPVGGRMSTLYEVKRVIYDNLAVVAGA